PDVRRPDSRRHENDGSLLPPDCRQPRYLGASEAGSFAPPPCDGFALTAGTVNAARPSSCKCLHLQTIGSTARLAELVRRSAPVLTRANTAFPTSRESHGGRCRTVWALLGGRRTRNAPPCPDGSKSRRDFLFKMSRCADVGFQRHCAARLAPGIEFACEVSAVGDADRGQSVRNTASSSHRNACSHRSLHVETW